MKTAQASERQPRGWRQALQGNRLLLGCLLVLLAVSWLVLYRMGQSMSSASRGMIHF